MRRFFLSANNTEVSLFRAMISVGALFFSIQLPQVCFAEQSARFSLQYEVKLDVPPSEILSSDQQSYLWRYEVLASEILRETVNELSRILKYQPKSLLQVNIVSRSRFIEKSGHLGWSSGMFLKGKIYLPIPSRRRFSEEKLRRTLRHEYLHAAIAELSGSSSSGDKSQALTSRAPAWIEEGLAQMFEGEALEKLTPALRRAIAEREIPTLSSLDAGFTALNADSVVVAYGTSLFAVRNLVNVSGYKSVRRYLRLLKNGRSSKQAFKRAFGRSQARFEKDINSQLLRWFKTDNWL